MGRPLLWLLAAWAAVLPFIHLGHPLWEVDDARYAEIPREMVERGDWITPTLDYLDYVEKPPLPYWATSVSYTLFGVSEHSAHLPLALWSLLAMAAMLWLGRWLYDLETGLAAAVMLGTSLEFQSLSHLATPDMPLTAMLAWTTAFWLRAMKRPDDAWWAGTAAGACMGGAVLCKGLIGVLFPVGWAVASAIFVPELRAGFKRSLLSGLVPAFLIVGLPWFWVMERRHPGFLGFFFGEQHFQRFLAGGSKYKRYGPPWYFIPVELVGAVPWTPVIGAALWTILTRWRATDAATRVLALWVLGVFAFFSASSSKLVTYILPLWPQQCLAAAAFLLARGQGGDPNINRWGQSPKGTVPRADRRIRGLALGLGLILVLAVPVVPIALGRLPGAPLPGDVPWYAGASVGLLGLSVLALCSREASWRVGGAAAGAGLAGILALASTRSAEPWVSGRPLALDVAREMKPGDRLISYGFYLHGLAFYTKSPVDVVNWVGELHYGRRNPANEARFGDDDTIRGLPDPERTTFVALRRKEAAYFTTLAKPAEIDGMRMYGPWALAKFAPIKARKGGGRSGSPSSGDGRAPAR